MIEDHLRLLVGVHVAAQDGVVAVQPDLVVVTMGCQVTVEHTHGHSIH